ncbi:MAG: flagellar biosynthesis protein FlhA [Gammaproteobacteria bacterium]|jgi:flagellar biosynthesis protein FlhA|nr:flagellar biosynthesis protein FlhA [Gammaproteobacteria bacterium]MBT3722630.1 flagellar biosynthesis protein FlhA [Gammaproteobacteria bacterium]MBT4076513.1 flagellar biosynthesis protein FlhA [Gammaproteobacteria bacterium]MBT4193050.1 flagellar biosynthesis protein FlhA [Gammaproteobacteria bacterium]MBT4451459.1 flagellar biosynthesis protein FlhA [Gammaproteobacteria bacterium]
MNTSSIFQSVRGFSTRGLGAPFVVILMLGMVILPLPPIALDMLFTFNIAFALIVVLVSVYALRPLDFTVFPTIILVATLLRLALNIASTRVVLLEGHTGTAAAGKVIEAFGDFVIGGNYAVGLVVFGILVIINFVVVTKGAGRVSEVSARFTLDAMPGKQMAIDADLNAGLCTQEEARQRRVEVAQEADFYGSMDGASKFVRGDAVAGILILFINIIGGLSIGILQHDMAASAAMENYTLLTIGDGLVAQIPSLVLSTATAIIVTRVSASQEMSSLVFSQMFEDPRALVVAAVILTILGIIPGMPNFAFLTIAFISAGLAYSIHRKQQFKEVEVESVQEVEVKPEQKELSWDDVKTVDLIGLEVGYGLIPLVDARQGGELMTRIKGVRKKLSQELGFLIQSVHIRDNLDLSPNSYRLSLLGVPMGEADVMTGKDLAINPGTVYGSLEGLLTKDPAFGLEAIWIDPVLRDHAQTLGYTVVDTSTVIATHLSQMLQDNAHELIGHEEVQELMDVLKRTSPKLVENLTPKPLSLSIIAKVLQNLLQEQVSIRDLRSIAETLADHGIQSQDAGMLTAVTRVSLGRQIVQSIFGMASELSVMTLHPSLEQILQQTVQGADGKVMAFEPGLAQMMHNSLKESTQNQLSKGQPAVLLVSQNLRAFLSRMVRHGIQGLHVLSYEEIPEDKQIKVIASVGNPAPVDQQVTT